MHLNQFFSKTKHLYPFDTQIFKINLNRRGIRTPLPDKKEESCLKIYCYKKTSHPYFFYESKKIPGIFELIKPEQFARINRSIEGLNSLSTSFS